MTTAGLQRTLRGVNYDVGTDYGTVPSRVSWQRDDVVRDLTAIRDDLHCTSVNLFGTDIGRLVEAATIARRAGLRVWLQPRLVARPGTEVLAHLVDAAQAAQALRVGHDDIVWNIGCGWSVFADA